MNLNCTKLLLLAPLNCTSTLLCDVYANATADAAAAACGPLPICCTFVTGGSSMNYVVRASGTGCSAYRSFVNLDQVGTPMSKWGQSVGVELQWASPPETVCSSQANCKDGRQCFRLNAPTPTCYFSLSKHRRDAEVDLLSFSLEAKQSQRRCRNPSARSLIPRLGAT